MISLISAIAGQVFQSVVVEAMVFVVCFSVALKFIELIRAQINPKTKGGE